MTWARQFRSDGARQRYLDIELDPVALTGGTLTEVASTHTVYDGDQPSWSRRTVTAGGSFVESGYELGRSSGTPDEDPPYCDRRASLAVGCGQGDLMPHPTGGGDIGIEPDRRG